HLLCTGTIELNLEASHGRSRHSEALCNFGRFLALLTSMGDEEGPVDGPHLEPGNILHQELLNLLGFGIGVVDDYCWDGLNAQEATRQGSPLALDEQVLA